MKVLVIIPAYNEELNIKSTVEKVISISKKSKDKIDYVIINDGSTDNTLRICRENKFNVISLIENLGIGGAVQTGYKYAYQNNYDIAIQFDGDGQHDEKYIEKIIEEIKNGNDLVIGSRFIESLSKFRSTGARRLGIRFLSFLIKVCTKKKIYDPTSGFRGGNAKIIYLFTKYYPVEYPEPESNVYVLRHNLKIKEIPVEMHERKFGTSSINSLKSIYYMFNVSISIIVTNMYKKGEK